MAKERTDGWFEMAKDLAKAERELEIEHWVNISFVRTDKDRNKKCLHVIDLPRHMWIVGNGSLIGAKPNYFANNHGKGLIHSIATMTNTAAWKKVTIHFFPRSRQLKHRLHAMLTYNSRLRTVSKTKKIPSRYAP